MNIRSLSPWIAVFILASSACQPPSAAMIAPADTATPLPSPTAAPATDTAIAPAPTATQPPATQPPPTPDQGFPPVVQSVALNPVSTGDQMKIYQDISFKDSDGDAYYLKYELVSATADGLRVEDIAIGSAAKEQQNGATVRGTWDCGNGSYEAVLRITIADKQGNKSEGYEYTLVCGAGNVPPGFPDSFDDNRNGWEVSDHFSILDGGMRMRSPTQNRLYWTSCSSCLATPERNAVSVDVSWSNSEPNALGLLVDDGICTPDGLIFIIGPDGYYAILQSVRAASGEWSHWRPFQDWTKHSSIRRPKDQANLITAVYEFADESLQVGFTVNGKYVTRVKIFGYNGANQCKPGLASDSEMQANFDNFNIAAASE